MDQTMTELEESVEAFKSAGRVLDEAIRFREAWRMQLDQADEAVRVAGDDLKKARARLLHAADPVASDFQHW